MANVKTLHGLTFFEPFNIYLTCSQIAMMEIVTQGQNFRVEIEMGNGKTFISDTVSTLEEAQSIADEVQELTNHILPWPYPE